MWKQCLNSSNISDREPLYYKKVKYPRNYYYCSECSRNSNEIPDADNPIAYDNYKQHKYCPFCGIETKGE